MAGEIDGVGGGLEHVAEHDMVHRLRLCQASIEGGFCGDGTQIRRGKIFQCATKGPKAGARAGEKNDLMIGLGGAHATGPAKEGRIRAGIEKEIYPRYHEGEGPTKQARCGPSLASALLQRRAAIDAVPPTWIEVSLAFRAVRERLA